MKPRHPPDETAAARTRGDRRGLRKHVTGTATSQSYRNQHPFAVVAIKATGERTLAGRFPTRQVAEQQAALLRSFARITGGTAIVERVSP